MSEAVENAEVIIYGVSEKYKESANVSRKHASSQRPHPKAIGDLAHVLCMVTAVPAGAELVSHTCNSLHTDFASLTAGWLCAAAPCKKMLPVFP